MSNTEYDVIVIDNGSGSIKAGFAGEFDPRVVLPTIIGRPGNLGLMVGSGQKNIYVGDEMQRNRNFLALNCPIQHGIITNWDDMEEIWNYIFNYDLLVLPENHPVLMTEALFNPKQNREKITEIMFEKFKSPSMYLGIQGVLALYASKRVTGIVLDCGYDVTQVVPVYEGYSLPRSIVCFDMAGRKLNEYMMKLLNRRGYELTPEAVNQVKEKLCFITSDFENEKRQEVSHKLPDGQEITIDRECFHCPEALFRPSTIGMEPEGMQDFINKSVLKCDEEFHRVFYGNLVLTGGTTMIRGFTERLRKEITILAPSNIGINIVAPWERRHTVWIGGSVLGSISTFSQMSISKKEFDEFGAGLINQKCF